MNKNTRTQISIFLLWIMIVVVPAFFANLLFDRAVSMEKSLVESTLKKKLNLEAQRYETVLDGLDSFIYSSIARKEMNEIMAAVYNQLSFKILFDRHEMLPELLSLLNKKGFPSLVKKMAEKLGNTPDFVLLLAPEANDCDFFFSSHYGKNFPVKKVKEALGRSHANFQKKINDNITKEFFSSQFVPELRTVGKILGIIDDFDNSLSAQIHRFSLVRRSLLSVWCMPLIDENLQFRFLVCGMSQKAINPLAVLRHFTEKFSDDEFKHEVVVLSEDSEQPFCDDGKELAILMSLPEAFRKMLINAGMMPRKTVRLKISAVSPEKLAGQKRKKISFFLLFSALILSGLPLGLAFNRFGIEKRLHRTVLIGFVAGIFLPVSGLGWLGVCYYSIHRQLQAEKLLDEMQTKLNEKEKSLALQICRNTFFQNIWADKLATMPMQKIHALHERTGFQPPAEHEFSSNWVNRKRLSRKFFTDSFIKPGFDDFIRVADNTRLPEIFMTFFSSAAREALYRLNAFSHLPPAEVQQMLQKSQLTMGLLDSTVDLRLLKETLVNEQILVANRFSLGRTSVLAHFWRTVPGNVTGLSFIQSSHQIWEHDLYEMLQTGRLQRLFISDGHEISLHFYLTHMAGLRSLVYLTGYMPMDFTRRGSREYFFELAQAVFSYGNEIRIDNLGGPRSHLICTRTALNGQLFMVAHATPISENTIFTRDLPVILVAVFAMLCCLLLARALTWVLLRPLPPFIQCIEEMAKQNYQWKLHLQSGDEFDQLAEAFNHLSVKLQEKEKISRLVSRNVLDAVSNNDEMTLKPGGSRVEAVVLFSDIRGFTTITEAEAPQLVVAMLNDYFSLVCAIIESHGGIIDKLIGDAVQAVFYAHECDNAALSAVLAAIEIRRQIPEFNRLRRENGLFTIGNGVGIASGMVVSGCVGSRDGKLDATLIGSLLNQAVRLESLSKAGKSSMIFIDAATAAMVKEKIILRQDYCDSGEEIIEVVI